MNHWETCYQNRDTPWDKKAPHPYLTKLHPGVLAGRWLVPGCGTGNDLPAILNAGASAVVGLDVAPTAVAAAKAKWEAQAEITILLQDFLALPDTPLAGTFQGVWEHTCFCAIDPSQRPQYVRAAFEALEAGGTLMACFYLNSWDPDEDPSQGPPFGSTIIELEGLFEPFFRLASSSAPSATFQGREQRELIQIYKKRCGKKPVVFHKTI